MIDWLEKISGKKNSLNMEKEELIGLRKEVTKLNKIVRSIYKYFSYKKITKPNYTQTTKTK
jgi:hypothetical protein